MNIDPITASLIVAGVGAVAGIGGALITTLITKRADERQHYRTLAIQAALAHWQFSTDIAKMMFAQGHGVEMPTFDILLIQKLRLMDVVSKENWDVDTIAAKIRELKDFTDTLVKETQPKKDGQA